MNTSDDMEICVDDNNRTVSIWLTKDESHDSDLREQLRPRFPKWKSKKYTIAVFSSGEADLFELTKILLENNLKELLRNECNESRGINQRTGTNQI